MTLIYDTRKPCSDKIAPVVGKLAERRDLSKITAFLKISNATRQKQIT